ncbi:hypothetical protein I6F35_00840 [Bradyrhizobium sp. BRP22]|uniref:hypothetical protein n=1 Tax=Bradyrhizobium sp. BRP22 TaxID=2793821 RepID=UPI001CD71D86|nr:hypothetical protein [Bradyrhizobium sp. BRP22]MCA1451757.1 hypothetical protein [Bradyrhizobium sp. BRP22]
MQYADRSFPRRWHFELTGSSELAALALLAVYLVIVVTSLTAVELAAGVALSPSWTAVLGTAISLCLLPLFAFANFSFGYSVGVAFFGMVTGFVWLSYFTSSRYDPVIARWSVLASLVAFLMPALLQSRPAPRMFRLKAKTMDLCVKILLIIAALILLLNFRYGFALVGLRAAEQLRAGIARPTLLNYATNNVIYAVLPFAFAFYAQRGSRLLAAVSLLLIPCFYPTLLNKTVLFAAVWLPFVFLIFRSFEPKQAAVISLGTPLAFGLLVHAILPAENPIAHFVFGYTNERMFAIPSIAIDYYADFFAAHPKTYFCQINIVRMISGCHYSEQLSVIFANQYGVGNLNASLFATEGIASVGLIWLPLVMFVCGLVLSIGNSCSRHLSPLMIATSSTLALLALLNVPLSTALLTNGLMLLFLLWYVCPDERDRSRNYSERPSGSSADFRADCIMEGGPVHFRRDGVSDAIVDGRVVVFERWVRFFKFLRG